MTRPNPERDQALVEAYMQGTPRTEIGRQFGISPHTVYGAIRRLGLEPQRIKPSTQTRAPKEGRNPVWVDTRVCPCCGVRALVHDETGCRRWKP